MTHSSSKALACRSTHSLVIVLALVSIMLVAAGCAQTPEPRSTSTPASTSSTTTLPSPATEHAQVSETMTATAIVVSVDSSTRMIALRGTDGSTFVVHAGPEVRNFAQIAAGDSVHVKYTASLAVSLKKPGDPIVPASATVAAGRAAPGQTPGASVAGRVTATVRIESVDPANDIVVFTGPSGELRAIRVQRDEGRQFIRGLEPGDRVEITYTEAAAIAVEKR